MAPQSWSLDSLLRLRCPACSKDSFRAGIFRTNAACGDCGQVFEREAGFYAGAIYPFYAAAAALGGLCVLCGHWAGLGLAGGMVLAGAAVALASPWLFWYARLSFLHTDHRFFGEDS